MNVSRIANLNIRPTDRKMRKTKEFIDGILPKEMPIDKKMRKAKELVDNILPKELPLEKNFRYVSEAGRFERIKDSIQISIDKMTRG